MNQRVSGVIIQDGKILLIRRIRNGEEYYVFPGGGVEENESIEDSMDREIKEELCLDVKKKKLIFQLEENQGRQEFWFLIEEFAGTAELGGEEKERMNENNQYYPIWVDFAKISSIINLYPKEAVKRILNIKK